MAAGCIHLSAAVTLPAESVMERSERTAFTPVAIEGDLIVFIARVAVTSPGVDQVLTLTPNTRRRCALVYVCMSRKQNEDGVPLVIERIVNPSSFSAEVLEAHYFPLSFFVSFGISKGQTTWPCYLFTFCEKRSFW